MRTIRPSDDSAKIEHLKYLAYLLIESRCNIPILLLIISLKMARKFNFFLEGVNNPGHFILRWKVEELDSEHSTVSEIKRTITEVLHRVSLNVDAHSRISLASAFNVQLSLNAFNLCLLLEPTNDRVEDMVLDMRIHITSLIQD